MIYMYVEYINVKISYPDNAAAYTYLLVCDQVEVVNNFFRHLVIRWLNWIEKEAYEWV